MKQGRCLTVLAVALALLGVSGAAWAAPKVSGRTSTVVEWYDSVQGDPALPAYQYLQLRATDLGAGLSFSGYGRLATDLENNVEADSRLYYGYLEKKGLLTEGLSARLGRQFLVSPAGATLMDGLKLDWKGEKLGLSLFGGGDVAYYEGYNAKDVIAGLSGSYQLCDAVRLGAGYVQRRDGGRLDSEIFGLNADVEHGAVRAWGDLQYDWLSDRVSQAEAGVKVLATERFDVSARYLYSLPIFSASSIYSVFAVDEYEEASVEAGYKIDTGLRAFARYTAEMYVDFDDANVYEAGIEKIRTGRFSGYLVGTLREEPEGEDLKGVKAYANYRLTQKVAAGVGAHIDTFERALDEDRDETTSQRLWADASVALTDKVDAGLKVERVESDLWDNYWHGRLAVNVRF